MILDPEILGPSYDETKKRAHDSHIVRANSPLGETLQNFRCIPLGNEVAMVILCWNQYAMLSTWQPVQNCVNKDLWGSGRIKFKHN